MAQPNKIVSLTETELETIVEKAAARGVNDAFIRMGIDVSDPVEMQRDFSHLRDWREATESVQKRGLLVIITILITGACAAFWMGFRGMIQ